MMNYFSDNPDLDFYLRHPDRNNHTETADAARTLDLLGHISAENVAPRAAEVDTDGPSLVDGEVCYHPAMKQNLTLLVQSGLYGLAIGSEYGGLGMSHTVSLMATELLARADLSFATIWGLQDCAETIASFASEEVKLRFLPRIAAGATCAMDLTEPAAGSDLQSARLTAHFDEQHGCWRLNGVKRFITNGGADIHLVLARTEPCTTDGRGLSLFLYDRSAGGMEVRRLERKMGIIGSPTASLTFHDAPAYLVGERRMGLIRYVMALMNNARLGVAAQAVGLCEAAVREAERYAAARYQFGKPIADFIQVREMLHAMRANTDAVRSLLYLAARHVDQASASKEAARTASLLTPLAKFIASELANKCAYDCIQVHGGTGYLKGVACERLFRDARVLSIYEGTSQMQVVAASKGIAQGGYLEFVGKLSHHAQQQSLDEAQRECFEMLQQGVEVYKERFEAARALSESSLEQHLRPLTEQMAYLVMGFQLLIDSTAHPDFVASGRFIAHSACR